MQFEAFVEHLADAYERLYDLVYLRNHPLIDVLVPDVALTRKQRAWELHDILTEAIEDLHPHPDASAVSRERRRYELMVLRYRDGETVEAVADRLAISVRHYYRERDAALQAIADLLWERHYEALAAPHDHPTGSQEIPTTSEDVAPADRLSLLRRETARMTPEDATVDLENIIEGVLKILSDVLDKERIQIDKDLPALTPVLSIDGNLLRQLLLSELGYLAAYAQNATLAITADVERTTLSLSVTVIPAEAVDPVSPDRYQDRLAALQEMAVVSGSQIDYLRSDKGTVTGFITRILARAEHRVLVVDDNEDILELFVRYLSPHHYRVITARTAEEALLKARKFQPQAITLDLMMPEQDGWSLMSVLRHQPETQDVPIIVCSVLKQKDLAMMLGAAAFLEKPVSERTLLLTVESITEPS